MLYTHFHKTITNENFINVFWLHITSMICDTIAKKFTKNLVSWWRFPWQVDWVWWSIMCNRNYGLPNGCCWNKKRRERKNTLNWIIFYVMLVEKEEKVLLFFAYIAQCNWDDVWEEFYIFSCLFSTWFQQRRIFYFFFVFSSGWNPSYEQIRVQLNTKWNLGVLSNCWNCKLSFIWKILN